MTPSSAKNNALKKPFLVVTGQSGAGLSSTLKCLEDIGYEAFDNFPLDLIPALLEKRVHSSKPIALGVDARAQFFSSETLEKTLQDIPPQQPHEILFIACNEEKLTQRFSETRRAHPLAKDRPVIDSIHAEKKILDPIKKLADHTIDTTDLSIHDLKRHVMGLFGDDQNSNLSINVFSFSYKKGVPRNADLVFDVRFLKNPHWDEALREMTGKDKQVGDYIRTDETFKAFEDSLKSMLEILIPAYTKEGKRYLTIAFGCTGGKHRSVYCTETINKWIKGRFSDSRSQAQHREIG